MNELVRIETRKIGEEEVQAVDARELHRKLEVKRDFSTWIKGRLEEAQLVEGQDYEVLLPKSGEQRKAEDAENRGGSNRIDYLLSINAAEHVALMERTDVGRRVRQYFIDFERNARKAFQALQEIEEDPLVVMARNHVALQREQQKQAIELAKHEIRLEMQQLQLEDQRKQLESERKLREESLEELHTKADTILEDMYQWRVTTYARKNDIRLNLEEAKRLGKEASRLSRETGRRIGRIFDPICQRNVNTYDPDILDLVFQRWQERNAEFN